MGFTFLVLILLFFPSFLLEKVVKASTKKHFIGFNKGFFNCFSSSSVPDYLIILLLFLLYFHIYLYFRQNFLRRFVDVLYYRIIKVLVILARLITYRNMRWFTVDCIVYIQWIYRSTSI